MTRIKFFFGKYEKLINIVVHFHIFGSVKQKGVGSFLSSFQRRYGKWGLGYIDYMTRLTSFILPLLLLLGRLKKGG